jgi:hypothetical protein
MDLVSLEERRRHDLIPEIISIESLLKYERNELFSQPRLYLALIILHSKTTHEFCSKLSAIKLNLPPVNVTKPATKISSLRGLPFILRQQENGEEEENLEEDSEDDFQDLNFTLLSLSQPTLL